jgi:hypothetical protein
MSVRLLCVVCLFMAISVAAFVGLKLGFGFIPIDANLAAKTEFNMVMSRAASVFAERVSGYPGRFRLSPSHPEYRVQINAQPSGLITSILLRMLSCDSYPPTFKDCTIFRGRLTLNDANDYLKSVDELKSLGELSSGTSFAINPLSDMPKEQIKLDLYGHGLVIMDAGPSTNAEAGGTESLRLNSIDCYYFHSVSGSVNSITPYDNPNFIAGSPMLAVTMGADQYLVTSEQGKNLNPGQYSTFWGAGPIVVDGMLSE